MLQHFLGSGKSFSSYLDGPGFKCTHFWLLHRKLDVIVFHSHMRPLPNGPFAEPIDNNNSLHDRVHNLFVCLHGSSPLVVGRNCGASSLRLHTSALSIWAAFVELIFDRFGAYARARVWSVSVNVAIIVIVVYAPSSDSLVARAMRCVHSNCSDPEPRSFIQRIQSIRSIFSPISLRSFNSPAELTSNKICSKSSLRCIGSLRYCVYDIQRLQYSPCSHPRHVRGMMQPNGNFDGKKSISPHTVMI